MRACVRVSIVTHLQWCVTSNSSFRELRRKASFAASLALRSDEVRLCRRLVRAEFAAAAARPEQHTVTCTGGGHAGSVCTTQQRFRLAVWLDDSNCDADHSGLVQNQLFGGRGIEQHRRGDSQRVCHGKRRRTLAVAVSFFGYSLTQCGARVHPFNWQELCRQQLSDQVFVTLIN